MLLKGVIKEERYVGIPLGREPPKKVFHCIHLCWHLEATERSKEAKILLKLAAELVPHAATFLGISNMRIKDSWRLSSMSSDRRIDTKSNQPRFYKYCISTLLWFCPIHGL